MGVFQTESFPPAETPERASAPRRTGPVGGSWLRSFTQHGGPLPTAQVAPASGVDFALMLVEVLSFTRPSGRMLIANTVEGLCL